MSGFEAHRDQQDPGRDERRRSDPLVPNRSLKTNAPISAAEITLVSRSADTSASGAFVCAHSTAP